MIDKSKAFVGKVTNIDIHVLAKSHQTSANSFLHHLHLCRNIFKKQSYHHLLIGFNKSRYEGKRKQMIYLNFIDYRSKGLQHLCHIKLMLATL